MRRPMSEPHHPFSPSRLGLRAACPGSYHQELGFPEMEGEGSSTGTMLHRAIADYLKMRGVALIEDENVRLVEACYGLFKEITSDVKPLRVLVESKMHLMDTDFIHVLLAGTPDVTLLFPDCVVVIDWKFYHQEIKFEDAALQMSAYMEMAMQECSRDRAVGYVYLPRLDKTYKRQQERGETIEEIKAIIEKSRNSMELHPGEHCKYCRALTVCPAVSEEADKLLDTCAVKHPIMDDSSKAIQAGYEGQIQEWPDEKLAKNMELLRFIEPLCKAVRKVAKVRVSEKPEEYPEWEVVSKRGVATGDPLELWRVLKHDIDREDFVEEATKVSVARLKKLWIDKQYEKWKDSESPWTKKDLADEWELKVGDLITVPEETTLRRKRDG
jgi:hypothetical protein